MFQKVDVIQLFFGIHQLILFVPEATYIPGQESQL